MDGEVEKALKALEAKVELLYKYVDALEELEEWVIGNHYHNEHVVSMLDKIAKAKEEMENG